MKIDEILFEDRKISLGLPTESEDTSWTEHVSSQGLGTFSDLFKNMNKAASDSAPSKKTDSKATNKK